MNEIDIRKTKITLETTYHDRGPPLAMPLRVGCAMAVVHNPFANRYAPDLMPFQGRLRSVGERLAQELLKIMGGLDNVQAYGKGAIAGEDGEIEHAAAWHEAGGWAMRAALGAPRAIVPAAKTIGGPGTRLMVPLGHIHASYVRSHLYTAEMTLWDGPRRDELLFGLFMASGGRPSARLGGLAADQISQHDGQR
ncbi:amino acid synthesis family protein [Komagataeibacter swingsii]|uniref:Amino acid synthesis family protein n=1 Tax=Komagataeibacter swingsii TaxID=215220 RepID=A0A850P307_9PROT|nr:amino acid synthesis family protein [Komagataeibacter swingsii]NVN38064.1 amino acid synthesis family protein [Komagataeibacter swingsii]